LFLVTLGFGGVLEILLTLFHLPLMAGVVFAVIILRMAASWNAKQKMKRNIIVPVKLQWGERTEEFSGLIDTGNHLREPLTGRPVSILDGTAAEKLLGQDWEQRKGYCLIPYHSIGAKQGWMKGVTADCMWVKVQGRDLMFQKPVLAVCEGAVSAGTEYQIILHPLHAAAS
ncbi:MAG: sigma-E processing peptidase SpoIIGA, partial [Candidatus Choladocola sp.]|nr:sigma-E processing peptidase SpoIIGA [Candidatus Choladocola sp.]